MTKKYIVFNDTDGITASHELFSSKKKAQEFIDKFPLRYAAQGYYKTSSMERIDPSEVMLRIEEA